jgi:hypothetical protein
MCRLSRSPQTPALPPSYEIFGGHPRAAGEGETYGLTRGPRMAPLFSGHYAGMGFDQYHEPAGELPAETRTFARLCASLTEEAEAIGWYEQRLALEPDAVARDVMRNALGEEYKHFSMDLEFLLRQKAEWREIARGILFQEGDIVEHGEQAEAAVDDDDPQDEATPAAPVSLGIGSLKGRSV